MPFVVQDAQNQNKTSKVALHFAFVPTWMAGLKRFSKNGQEMALKWLKIAFSVLNQLSKLPSKIYCALRVTNQSTEILAEYYCTS